MPCVTSRWCRWCRSFCSTLLLLLRIIFFFICFELKKRKGKLENENEKLKEKKEFRNFFIRVFLFNCKKISYSIFISRNIHFLPSQFQLFFLFTYRFIFLQMCLLLLLLRSILIAITSLYCLRKWEKNVFLKKKIEVEWIKKLEEVEGKTSQEIFMENINDDFKFVAIHSIWLSWSLFFHIASRGLEINYFWYSYAHLISRDDRILIFAWIRWLFAMILCTLNFKNAIKQIT